jgi:hypothetical protein
VGEVFVTGGARPHLRNGAVAVVLSLWTASTLAATGGTASEVSWTELRYGARKLLLTAHTEIRVDTLSAREAAAALREVPGGGGIPAGAGSVARITLDTRMPFGREETVTTWVRAGDGTALQTEKLREGKGYWKLIRYTADGFYQWRAEAQTRAEKALGHEAWGKQRESRHDWKARPRVGVPVIDSYALLYLISAARLDRAGRELVVALEADDRLVQLRFVGAEVRSHDVDFVRTGRGRDEQVEGAIRVRALWGEATALGEQVEGDVATGLLDMKGPVTVLVEEGSGIPVEVQGRVDGIGELKVKLEEVVRSPVIACSPPTEASATGAAP